MDITDRIKIHDDNASAYDSQAKEYNSHGHEVLFGMCYEYIEAGDTLLDLGIGTGLGSVNFAKAGLIRLYRLANYARGPGFSIRRHTGFY